MDLNATQAAIRAGYSPNAARQQAARLLRCEHRAQIAEGKAQQLADLDVTAQDVLRELAAVGLSDIRVYFDEAGNLRPITSFRNANRRPSVASRW